MKIITPFIGKVAAFFSLILFISCQPSTDSNSSKAVEQANEKFIWDFSEQKKFVYSFHQTLSNDFSFGEDRDSNPTKMEGKGKLNVRIKKNRLADLSITDLVLNELSKDSSQLSKLLDGRKQPPMVVQDMNEQGTFNDPQVDLLFKVIFPLPTNDLNIGEKNKISLSFPINAMGSRLYVKGNNELTFESFEMLGDNKCAVLKGNLDVSDLEVPEEIKGEIKSSMKGKATYYFDIENNYYVGVDLKMVMDMKMNLEKNDWVQDPMNSSMRSENEYVIRLEQIEE